MKKPKPIQFNMTHIDRCSKCWHSKGEHFRLDGSCVADGCKCTSFGGN